MIQELWELFKTHFSIVRAFLSVFFSILVLVMIEHFTGPHDEKIILSLFVIIAMVVFLVLDQLVKKRPNLKRTKK